MVAQILTYLSTIRFTTHLPISLKQVGEELRSFIVSTRFYAIDQNRLQDTIGNILALEINIGSLLATEETVEDDDLNIMTLQVIFNEIDLILFLL